MAMHSKSKLLDNKEIELIKRRIESEYHAVNVCFMEETNHYSKFLGTKENKEYVYSYDKYREGFIIESEK